MVPTYRIFEIILYSMLNFVPYLIIALYPFRRKFRFGSPVTFCLIGAVTIAQIGLGVWAGLFAEGNAGIISAVSTIVYFAFYFIAIKAHFGKILFTLLMLSNIANFVVMASKCIEGIFFLDFAHQSYRWTFSVVMIGVEMLVLIPLFFYVKTTYTSAFEKEIGQSSWRFLWLIPATFYVVWYFHLYNNEMSSLEMALEASTTLFLFVINLGGLLVYHIVVCLINTMDANVTLTTQNHELAMQKLQYDNLQDRINEARQAKHDIRHHITIMDEYLNHKEYDKLHDYLQSYKKSLPDDSAFSFCSHYAVNALLLYFAQQAQKNKIDFDVTMAIPKTLNLPDNVLSVVLGNLLENALEACLEVTDRLPKITIKGKTEAGTIFFKIKNTYNGNLKQDKNGYYLSTKHNGRGIGLASIRNIVKQYDGILEIEQKDDVFTVSLLLNIPEK